MSNPLHPSDTQPPYLGEPNEEIQQLVGLTIADKYRVVSFLARGSMGVVYVAEQVPIGRKVALKVLFPNTQHVATDEKFEQRFQREGATCGKLRSPNTVTLYDYGHFTHNGRNLYYMAMEYIEGRTLTSVLREGPVPVDRAVRIALEISRALREAHDLGIVHRDLKPGNVMLVDGPEGETIKVLDFGIAKLTQVEEDVEQDVLTVADSILGSPRYMAPEQIRSRTVDARTDIYALAVIVFEMITGAAPYKGKKSIETMLLHVHEPIPSFADRAVRPIPPVPAVEAVVRRALAKEPGDRYPDIHAFRTALKRAVDPNDSGRADEISASTMRAAVLGAEKEQGRRRMMAGALLLLLGGGVALVGIVLFGVIVLGGNGGQTTGSTPPPVPAAAPAPVAPAPAPAEVQPAEPAAPVAVEHTVRLVSKPTGAKVLEDGRELGKTPLEVKVPAGASRTWKIKLDGYDEGKLEAKDVQADAELEATLRKKPAPAAPRPAAPAPPSDIKFKR